MTPRPDTENERVFYEVADIQSDFSDYPFAVVAIYPDRPNVSGCVGIVQSLHYSRAEAELAANTCGRVVQ